MSHPIGSSRRGQRRPRGWVNHPSQSLPTFYEQEEPGFTDGRCFEEWYLVQKCGNISFKLDKYNCVVIGSENSDIVIACPSIEKQHTILKLDPTSDRFVVKDMNTENGTYVNGQAVPAGQGRKLNHGDLLRFGYDRSTYQIRCSGEGTQRTNESKQGLGDRKDKVNEETYSISEGSFGGGLTKQLNRLKNFKRSQSCGKIGGGDNQLESREKAGVIIKCDYESNKVDKAVDGIISKEKCEEQKEISNAICDSNLCGRRKNQGMQMQQSARGSGVGSRVASPSLTLDSGRGSTSAPSSPCKEMSPVPAASVSLTTGTGCKDDSRGDVTKELEEAKWFERKNNGKEDLEEADFSLPGDMYVSGCVAKAISKTQNTDCGDKDGYDILCSDSNYEWTGDEEGALLQEDLSCGEDEDSDQIRKDSLEDDELDVEEPATKQKPEPTPAMDVTVKPQIGDGNFISSHMGSVRNEFVRCGSENSGTDADLNIPNEIFGHEKGSRGSDALEDSSSVPTTDSGVASADTSQSKETGESDRHDSSEGDGNDDKKLSPMAFTIDFGSSSKEGIKPVLPKRFRIGDSISQFAPAPRHRRNYSLSKAEDLMEKAKQSSSTGLDNPPENGASSLKSKTLNSYSRNRGNPASINSGGLKKSSSTGSSYKPKSENDNSNCVKEAKTCEIRTMSSASKTFKPLKAGSPCDTKPKSSVATKKTNLSSFNLKKDSSLFSSANDANNNNDSSNQKCIDANVGKAIDCLEEDEKVDENSEQDCEETSETGTYTVEKDGQEVNSARKSIDSAFGVSSQIKEESKYGRIRGRGSPGWIQEWAEFAAAQQKSSVSSKNEDELGSTRYFLKETENLVTAMQARVTRRLSNGSGKVSDSDEDSPSARSRLSLSHTKLNAPNCSPAKFSRSLVREASVLSDSGYTLGYNSDSSNDGQSGCCNNNGSFGSVKYNRAFNIRRSRAVGYDSDGCALSGTSQLLTSSRQGSTLPAKTNPRPQSGSSVKKTPSTANSSNSNGTFSRNDGGRFSLRMQKSKGPPYVQGSTSLVRQNKPNPPKTLNTTSNTNAGAKSDLISSNRKQDSKMNPSKKPPSGNRSNSTLTAKEVEMANWKRRKNYDPLKAAAEGRKKKPETNILSSSQRVAEEKPESSNGLLYGKNKKGGMVSSRSVMSFQKEEYNPFPRSPIFDSDEEMAYVYDCSESPKSNSPSHLHGMERAYRDECAYYATTPNMHRSKHKMEALDNLVIATIHSLSGKVRTSSRHLLEKLMVRYDDDENGALIEEMISQLKDLEINGSSNGSSPNKSPSRELSGTLKNLKKLEQVVLVLDRVLCDDNGSDVNL